MKACQIVVVSLLAVVISGCNVTIKGNAKGVAGSGVSKSEARDVTGFDRVSVTGYGSVNISPGKHALVISADDNLLELIESKVENRVLIIKPKESISPKSDLVFDIQVGDPLRGVAIEGAANLNLKELGGDDLEIDISGAGNATGNGTVSKLTVNVNGTGLIDLAELKAEDVALTFSGAGSGSVFASRSIDAEINGIGTIEVFGNPQDVKKNINGLGILDVKN